jgi:hypothetical protein
MIGLGGVPWMTVSEVGLSLMWLTTGIMFVDKLFFPLYNKGLCVDSGCGEVAH